MSEEPVVGGRESESEPCASPTPDPRLAVIIELAILIIIFYAFTKAFA